MVEAPRSEALDRVSERVLRLADQYEPPDFSEVPTSDAALFLAAIDHRTGYGGGHQVDGQGPYEGSALLWALALGEERRRPGTLTARSLADVDAERIAALFGVDGETVTGPERRAELWRDLAAGLTERYGGEARELIAGSGGRLGGSDGMLARLAEFEAYADPLQKKSFLVCKIWERRGWLRVEDPGSWEICADNVLMRLALRAGLVSQGEVEEVREATRGALKDVAERTGVLPPLLDDLLWELGREDRDLLGCPAGDLREPARREGVDFY